MQKTKEEEKNQKAGKERKPDKGEESKVNKSIFQVLMELYEQRNREGKK